MVVGSAGLSVRPDRHEIEVEGREFWTWCAYDSLRMLRPPRFVQPRDSDRDHQQCDRESEDAVAECLDACYIPELFSGRFTGWPLQVLTGWNAAPA